LVIFFGVEGCLCLNKDAWKGLAFHACKHSRTVGLVGQVRPNGLAQRRRGLTATFVGRVVSCPHTKQREVQEQSTTNSANSEARPRDTLYPDFSADLTIALYWLSVRYIDFGIFQLDTHIAFTVS